MLKFPLIVDLGLQVARCITRDSECVRTAVRLLKNGEVIGLPTDTIYGIACDAQNDVALSRLYTIKSRDCKKPIAICVGRVEDVSLWGNTRTVTNDVLNDLLPGPVTLLFDRSNRLNRNLNPDVEKVGIRVPDHPFIQIVANELGRPLALTSANISNEPSSLAVEEFDAIWKHLGAVFDGGRLENDRLGSTILDLSVGGRFAVVREGQAACETYAKLTKRGLLRCSR
ncbi:yrdC domain-containing protein, mitochondrial [Nilaparvata lugens]|uniref:yrdC domain-containing protein, mitochondrial n=1 Tax=Nilaparvata lugens TaxID=108931 RepID=UPI00193DE7D8|nr:yrdC domain-containing protein, mitochondrial [Nilaparvata lugens]